METSGEEKKEIGEDFDLIQPETPPDTPVKVDASVFKRNVVDLLVSELSFQRERMTFHLFSDEERFRHLTRLQTLLNKTNFISLAWRKIPQSHCYRDFTPMIQSLLLKANFSSQKSIFLAMVLYSLLSVVGSLFQHRERFLETVQKKLSYLEGEGLYLHHFCGIEREKKTLSFSDYLTENQKELKDIDLTPILNEDLRYHPIESHQFEVERSLREAVDDLCLTDEWTYSFHVPYETRIRELDVSLLEATLRLVLHGEEQPALEKMVRRLGGHFFLVHSRTAIPLSEKATWICLEEKISDRSCLGYYLIWD